MRSSLRTVAMAGLSCLPVWGIVIQDVYAPGYITDYEDFSGVVSIGIGGGGFCSGALISPYYVLTAGHCVSGKSSWTVNFQTGSTQTAYASPNVANAYLNPNYGPNTGAIGNLYHWDTAVLQLSMAAPSDAAVYGIDTSLSGIDLGSTLLDLVGYGLGGDYSTGVQPYGVRRHAVNTLIPGDQTITAVFGSETVAVKTSGGVITGICQSVGPAACKVDSQYSPTPDSPLAMALTLPSTPSGSLGLINGGDSGSPLLYCVDGTCRILGVTDFGDLPQSGGYAANLTYSAGFQNLTEAENYRFIQSVVAPEPGVCLLWASGLAAIWLLKRRASGNRCGKAI